MFRLWQACRLLLTLALTSSVGIGPASADFLPISVPDAAYLRRTNPLPIGGSDGRLSVQFSSGTCLPDGLCSLTLNLHPWNGDWGTPPQVQSATTQSLVHASVAYGGRMVLTFSSPIKTFGLEARPGIGWDRPRDQLVWAEFYKGGTLYPWLSTRTSEFAAPLEAVGGIERRVFEAEGALLFAASTSTDYFTRVDLQFYDVGFIANLRYSVGEPPEPSHAQFFARSIGRPVGSPTVISGQPDQVTMNVGETLNVTYLVRFRNTDEFLDVTDSRNTDYFTDPPLGQRWSYGWQATEEARNRIFPLYARYYEPYTGQSITDTIRVYVRP